MSQVELPSYLDKEQIIQSIRQHETLMKSLWAAYPSLLEKHPDRWILWDGKHVVHASNTADELLRHIQDNGIDISAMEIEHLETNPKAMIL